MNFLLTRSTPIVLIGATRLDYFAKTLDSILATRENRPLHIVLDKGVNQAKCKQIDHLNYLKTLDIPNSSIVERSSHFGLGKNMIGARRYIFDEVGAPYAFIMEDDLVVSRHYFTLCENVMEWCERHYTNVGVVQGWNQHVGADADMADAIEVNIIHWWGYLMSKTTWDTISPNMYEYADMLPILYKRRNFRQIQNWVNGKIAAQNTDGLPKRGANPIPLNEQLVHRGLHQFASSQDAITAKSCYMHGIHKVCTYLNRAKYIGQWGEHYSPHTFERNKMNLLTPWEFEEDANRTEFRVVRA